MSRSTDRGGTGLEVQRSRSEAGGDDYRIRQYRPGDREQFLTLYADVFGKHRTDEWLQWRYGGPYTDRIRMYVAERDGELVGAEPFISLALRAGGETVRAVQPADAMVHPDHRRNGLLTRMTERALRDYADAEPALVYNFPNELAEGVYLDLGWQSVGRVATAYRIQRPGALSDVGSGRDGIVGGLVGTVGGLVETVGDVGARATYRSVDVLARSIPRFRTPSNVAVTRHDRVPADRLAALYDGEAIPRLHIPRTAAFYRWRFANPEWDATTYVARRDGDPVAAIVACTQASEGVTVTKLMDALPMSGSGDEEAAFDRLLRAVVADHRSVDVIAAAEDTLPSSTLARFGFLPDDRPPLSRVTTTTRIVARPIPIDRRGAWSVGGCSFASRSGWHLPFAEQDTSL